MIVPVLVEKLAWPLWDWSLAIAAALGHSLQGTLCTIPAAPRRFKVNDSSGDAY